MSGVVVNGTPTTIALPTIDFIAGRASKAFAMWAGVIAVLMTLTGRASNWWPTSVSISLARLLQKIEKIMWKYLALDRRSPLPIILAKANKQVGEIQWPFVSMYKFSRGVVASLAG